MAKPTIPKGTRDFLPHETRRRNYIFNTISTVFEKYGYTPIETPAMENLSTLTGKYGEEGDRLIFKILESGETAKTIFSEITQFFDNDLHRQYHSLFNESLIEPLVNALYDYIRDDEFELTVYVQTELMKTREFGDKLSRIREKQPGFYAVYAAILGSELNEFVNNRSMHYGIEFLNENETILEGLKRVFIEDSTAFVERAKHAMIDIFDLPRYSLVVLCALEMNYLDSKASSKALRYDLTVPFARYVVNNFNELSFPFKRYQIQPVWRADRPQKGRYREFYQCDADVVGSDSLLNEVEMIQLFDEVLARLGLDDFTIKINNRKILSGIAEVAGVADQITAVTVALDKLDKIGADGVKKELRERGIPESAMQTLEPLMAMQGGNDELLAALDKMLAHSETGRKGIAELREVLAHVAELGLNKAKLQVDVTLARGLDYYTGAIFEVLAGGVKMGSICGGGRYDDLTSIFGMDNLSGVGISFGADRIYDVLLELGKFPETVAAGTKVLFINFGENESRFALKQIKALREAGISCELYPDNAKMKKQMKFANDKNVQYVALAGENEIAAGKVNLKNMENGEQQEVEVRNLVNHLK